MPLVRASASLTLPPMATPVLAICLCLCSLSLLLPFSVAGNVTYDHRSLIIDGQRKLLLSASIHYPRSVPGMWPDLVATAKEGGVDVIETYVFWNGHELSPGNYYFGGRYNLVKFVKVVQRAKMYLILRIGPFVAAEWNFGGVPVWLHYQPGTTFRTDNESWKSHMKSFMTRIVNLMKKEKLFASQGGPIILAQVENEYGDIEKVYGEGGKPYAMWAAHMAVSQDIGIPWIMCQQHDAPDPVAAIKSCLGECTGTYSGLCFVSYHFTSKWIKNYSHCGRCTHDGFMKTNMINTCNSFYCDQFKPNSADKPKLWTENWPGWFKTFGAKDPHRPPEDVAYSVARFFQKGGSLQNYYMYHGGTNFGRTAGGPFITTSYDYDAPIDEYGLARLPKWGHLRDLHKAIKLCEHALLSSEPKEVSLGPLQEAHIYNDNSGKCAAFIANMDDEEDKILNFENVSYHLPAWSISILPDCKNVAFNTAKVASQTSIVEMIPDNLHSSSLPPEKGTKNVQWDVFTENAGIWGSVDFVKNGFVDHLNTTQDSTDYLWYTTSIQVDEKEDLVKNGAQPVLHIDSKGHAVHAFVNQKLQGSASGNGTDITFKCAIPVFLKAGKNNISLLSMTVGLQNAGPFYEWVGAGLTSVKISGFRNELLDLTSNTWVYKIGLEGEHQKVYAPAASNAVNWMSTADPPKNQPLTWYKTVVDPPYGNDPVGLDMIHMGKGQAWLNGEPIGRYWPRTSSIHDECPASCNYRGKFFPSKCSTGCGEPSQRWYHVPRSWFKPSGNVLVIFEEKGGDPTKVTFSRRVVTGVCGLVSEDYPHIDLDSWESDSAIEAEPTLRLECPKKAHISAVKFASFGNPSGNCGSYSKGSCHDPNSLAIVEKHCLNKNSCEIALSGKNFKTTLCPDLTKKLAVQLSCS